MSARTGLALLAATFAIPCVLRAEETALRVDQLEKLSLEQLLNLNVTVAARTPQRQKDVPGSVTVITREQILDTHARTLGEILRILVPSVDVVPTFFNYGDRVDHGVYSRGVLADFGQQILILYNGKNRFNEVTGEGPLGAVQFTLENVERIEVSRTPVPLYGANAMTVINIVTREQFLEGAELAVEGSVNEHGDIPQQKRFSGSWGATLGGWHLGASVQYYDDTGQPHPIPAGRGGFRGDSRTLRDGTKSAVNATANIRTIDRRFEAEAWFKSTVQDAFLSGLTPSQSIGLYDYAGSVLAVNARYRLVDTELDTLNIVAAGTSTYWHNTADYAGSPLGYAFNDHDVYIEAINQLRFTAWGRHCLVAGIKLEREGVTDAVTYEWTGSAFFVDRDPDVLVTPIVGRHILAFYAEDTWKILPNKLTLLAGVRVDLYDGFRGNGFGTRSSVAANPRVGIQYGPLEWLTFKVLYASAFRPPGTAEQLGGTNFSLSGNQSLTSEQVHTAELSASVRVGGFRGQLTGFYERFYNKISFVTLANGSSTYTNLPLNRIVGGDLEIAYHFTPATYLWVQGSVLRAYDLAAGADVPFLPKVYVNAGFNVRLARFNLNGNAFFRGPRPIPTNPGGLDPFPINRSLVNNHFGLNGSLTYEATRNVRIYLLIQNITGRINVVPLGVDGAVVPMQSRVYWLGVNVQI